MSLRLLRPEDGIMMKIVKYDLVGEVTGNITGSASNLYYHNHYLDVQNVPASAGEAKAASTKIIP